MCSWPQNESWLNSSPIPQFYQSYWKNEASHKVYLLCCYWLESTCHPAVKINSLAWHSLSSRSDTNNHKTLKVIVWFMFFLFFLNWNEKQCMETTIHINKSSTVANWRRKERRIICNIFRCTCNFIERDCSHLTFCRKSQYMVQSII